MSEPVSKPRSQPSQDVPADGPRRPARSGEGLDSLMTRLREQEDQRVQNAPTTGISHDRN